MKSLSVKLIALVIAGASFQSASAQTEAAKPAPAVEKATEIATPATPATAITAETAAPAKEVATPAPAATTIPVPASIAPAAAAEAKKKEKEKEKAVLATPPANK